MNGISAKQQRLYSFIENISGISDKIYQERVWVRDEGPECDDIDDAVCDFFDDGDPILEKYEDFGITEIQHNLLLVLREKLDKFVDTYGIFSPEKPIEILIQLPEWQQIRDVAKKVLQAFNHDLKLPSKIPPNFKIKLPARQMGVKYVHPENKHTYFRVTPAKYYSLYSKQQVSYINYKVNGKCVGQQGKMIENDSLEAYIPSEKFDYRDFGSAVDKKQIVEEFLKNIFRLSDEKYQQRVWIQGNGPECNEIDDAVCDFFDDGDSILDSYQELGILEGQYELLTKFKEKLHIFTEEFQVFSPEKSTEELIHLPQWQEIRNLSKKILQAFNYQE